MADVSVDPSAASQVFASYGSNGGVAINDVDADAGVYDIVAGLNVDAGSGSVSTADEAQIRAIVSEAFEAHKSSLGEIASAAVEAKLTNAYLTSVISGVARTVVNDLLSDGSFRNSLTEIVNNRISGFLSDVTFKDAVASAVSTYAGGTEFATTLQSYVDTGIASYTSGESFSELVEEIVLGLFGGGDEEF